MAKKIKPGIEENELIPKEKKPEDNIGHEGVFRNRSHELRKSLIVPFKRNMLMMCQNTSGKST